MHHALLAQETALVLVHSRIHVSAGVSTVHAGFRLWCPTIVYYPSIMLLSTGHMK